MYLSIDGGGSKLRMLLVDDNLRVVRYTVGPGINTNFTSVASAKETIERAVETCVDPGTLLDGVSLSMLGLGEHMEGALRERAEVRNLCLVYEGEMGLLAGLGEARGYLALSGTGSDVFFHDGNRSDVIGGWGILLGDMGSGGDIGQRGLQSAILSHEGMKGSARMLDLLKERYGINEGDTFRQVVCRTVYEAPAPRSVVASFASIVGEAARQGDRTAISILRRAGRSMAEQMIALIRRTIPGNSSSAPELPVTLSGGAWKGSWQMLDAFRGALAAVYPEIDIRWPMFDAVAGGIIRCAVQAGMPPSDAVDCLKWNVDLEYAKPEDWKG
jgi:N-acetylglucosamine kinase-like BadF-type ATPase